MKDIAGRESGTMDMDVDVDVDLNAESRGSRRLVGRANASLLAVAAVMALGVSVTGCSSGSSDSSDAVSTGTTAAADGVAGDLETPSSDGTGRGNADPGVEDDADNGGAGGGTGATGFTSGDLVGQWSITAGESLAASMGPQGGMPPGLDCTGEIVMDFADGGTFAVSGDMSCTVGAVTGTGVVAANGSWSLDDGQLGISDVVNETQVEVMGQHMPVAVGPQDGTYPVSVADDKMTITITTSDGVVIRQPWTRVS